MAATQSLGSCDDSMSALYMTIADLRTDDMSIGQGQVADDEASEAREDAAEKTAIQQEEANASGSGSGFFSSIGNFFSDIAGDLVHGDIGKAVDDAGHDLDQMWNSPKFWSDLECGLADIAIVAGAAAATVATAGVAGVAVGAGAVTAIGVVGAAAGAGAELANARGGHFNANVEDAAADVTAADDRLNLLQQDTDNVLSDLKQTDQSHERTLQGLEGAMQTHDDAAVAPASMTIKG